nr:MAG TPA: hypothetical protein [Crassvirales sp.]
MCALHPHFPFCVTTVITAFTGIKTVVSTNLGVPVV